VVSASTLNIVSETAPLISSLPSTTMIPSLSVTVSAIVCQIGLNFRAAPEREPLMSTAVSPALVVKLDFSPAPASDAAAALAPTAPAIAATMVASLSAAAFLRLLINAAASAITAAMKFVRRHPKTCAAQPQRPIERRPIVGNGLARGQS